MRFPVLLPIVLLLAACGGDSRRYGAPVQPYELRLEAEFRAADTSGDELLTAEEFASGFPGVDVTFQDLDTDGNGRVSLAEMKAYAQWRRIASWPDRHAP